MAGDSRRRTGLIVGGVIAVLAVVAVVIGLVVAFTGSSDEDQIRAVVEEFQKAFNDNDFEALEPILCKAAEDFNQHDFEKLRDSDSAPDSLDFTVESVVVHGDTATAMVGTNDSSDKRPAQFVREGGDWKLCEFP